MKETLIPWGEELFVDGKKYDPGAVDRAAVAFGMRMICFKKSRFID